MTQIENTANVRKGRSFSHNKKQIIGAENLLMEEKD
jgi:hypothetical protein